MEKLKAILIGIGSGTILILTLIALTAATTPTPTPPTPATYNNLTKVTSRDGITVYHYGDCVIVKTSNSISITR